MNDPSIHDIVAGSLDRHGRAVGTPDGDLGDVLRRVDRRRTRRRSTAVIGSTLAVAAGAAGIMLVAGPADAPAPGDGGATPTAGSWGCNGFLSSDGVADYWATCEAFPGVVRPTLPVLPPATIVFPMTAVPSTIAPAPTSTVPPVSPLTHTVAAGDSVYAIAALYGVDPLTLAEFNGWPEGIEHPLAVGDTVLVTLSIPTTAVVAPSSVAVTNPPICESGAGAALVTVPCSSAVPSTIVPTVSVLTTDVPTASTPDTVFRCTDPLGSDLAYTYYLSCEPWGRDAMPPPPTTEAFSQVFATTAPPTTMSPDAPPAPTVPPPVATTTPTTAYAEQIYTVAADDSLSSIAALYGIDVSVLVRYNAWPEGLEHPLFPGDTVKIPPGSRVP